MRLLGIANGSLGGNSEILLKAALEAAVKADPSVTANWFHAPSVAVPLNPNPLEGSLDMDIGMLAAMRSLHARDESTDDRMAVLDAILDADAIIFATPVYSHQPAGMLKALFDRILGPFTDAAFASRLAEAKASGDPRAQEKPLDKRILKPRVVGFMAVAGSTTPDQISMALPTLHLLVYSIHAKVVDQEVITGCGSPGSVLYISEGQAVERARELGKNVASQIGKQFDEAVYLGPEPPGACPYCHLAKIELICDGENNIGCITCGARGRLAFGNDGIIRPIWEMDSVISSITMAGKQTHVDDLMHNARKEAEASRVNPQAVRELKRWRSLHIPRVQLPSMRLSRGVPST